MAPLAIAVGAEAAPVLVTSFLSNPVAWTETAGALTMGAAGYESELPSAGATKMLNPGPAKLTQNGLEHIVERHWASSGARKAGKFLQGTTLSEVKDIIGTATTNGSFRPNSYGRPGTIAEFNFGKAIGITTKGLPAHNLRVVINPNGNVTTAFPY